MKLNIVAIRIWLITFGLILFSFISTAFFYNYFYSEQVEENYIDDFEEFIVSVEELTTQDPQFVVNNINTINDLHSRVHFALLSNEVYTEDEADWHMSFPDEVYETIEEQPSVVQTINVTEDVQIRSGTNSEENDNIPYVFHIMHFDLDDDPFILYSYADLSFLASIENTLAVGLTSLIVLYSILAFGAYYIYLRRHLSAPINAMTNIAFDYARDDFSRQLPVSGRDDLSELAMAMNKMGHSLETNRKVVKQDRELLSHILISIETGILYYDPDKTLVTSNPAGEMFLTQYNVELENFANEVEFVNIDEKLNEVMRNKTNAQFNMEMEEFYYNVSIVPLFEEDSSEIRGVLLSAQDLTKEHQLNQMRVDFISNVSHELRTPLVMIQGYSEAIIDDVAETIDEKKEMARIIQEESQRMNRMANEMLDLSRMEAGVIDLRKEVIPLQVYFEKMVFRFNQMAMEEGVTLDLILPDEDIKLWMDKDKMDQVFVNLIDNAIRHTGSAEKEDKRVTIRVFEDPLLEVVVMEVKDTGSGIPEEDLPYIFDRFFKADKSRENDSDNAKGTGIGLSLVKNIVEKHEGSIIVESKLGQGTSFIIHLPYTVEEPENNQGKE